MRILYVITKANWGGAQRYVYDLATAAKERGDEAAVAYGTSGELAKRLESDGIRTIEISGLGRDVRVFQDIGVFWTLFRLFRAERPDVVHVNSSKIGGLGAVAARLAGINKIVFTAHAWAFNEERPRHQKAIIHLLAWLTVLFSTKTIVVSHAMKRQMRFWPGISRKMEVIPNGTRAFEFLSREEARRELVKIQPKLNASNLARDFWVGTVAELHPVKGLRYAIGAIDLLREQIPNLRYLIVSDGAERAELERLIRERMLEAHVFLLGFVPEAPRFAKAYDVFLLPSLSEAFGISIIEAGLAELPTIGTKVGGIPEIIDGVHTGLLIPPKNPTAIAHALSELYADPERRHALGLALKQQVEREFSLERVVKKTFALY